MADYAALKAELLAADMAGLSDEAAAEKLNTDTTTQPLAGRYLLQAGILSVLGLKAGVVAMEGLKAAAAGNTALAYVVETLQGKGAREGIDFGDPQVQGMLDQLQGQGVLTAPTVAALKAYGSETVTRAVALAGWGIPATAGDVHWARRS